MPRRGDRFYRKTDQRWHGGGRVGGATHVDRGDGAGGVVGDELDVDVVAGVEVGALGAEAGAVGLLEAQREGVAVIGEEAMVRAPHELDVVLQQRHGRRSCRRCH